MYLESLTLENFRSCERTTVHFAHDLTILAGENNAGKTNVLDALRLLTAPVDGKRDRWAVRDDIRRGAADLSIVGRFAGLNSVQRGLLVTALGEPTSCVAAFGLRYPATSSRGGRGTARFWAGPREGGEPEPEARDLIRHVHLPALRDAERELASGSPERIAFLVRHLAEGDDSAIEDLEKQAGKAFADLETHPLLTKTQAQVSSGLRDLTAGLQPHEASLRFGEPSLRQLARDLRFFLRRHGLDPIDLGESGLGYANMLFLATVLVELQAARETELTLFLVEEPEAHLHPQFQAATLEYLRDQARKSQQRSITTDAPEGRIQVIVSTHSPHLTSAVSCTHVVVLHAAEQRLPKSDQPTGGEAKRTTVETVSQAKPTGTTATAAIPISKLGLAEPVVAKIDRYLDVTRSALLFSRRVILVEGLAEALLLPVMASRCVLTQQPEALARFRAATLVPIDGVDFAPYVCLLLTAFEGYRLADRVIVITDEDPGTTGENRPKQLVDLAGKLGAADRLQVCIAKSALEAELFRAGNRELLKSVFLDCHPRSEERWAREVDGATGDKAEAFVQLCRLVSQRKGDFSQRLALEIDSGAPFHIPSYLDQAIKGVAACGE